MIDEQNQQAESITQRLRRNMNEFARLQAAAWSLPTDDPKRIEAGKAFNELGETLTRFIDEFNYIMTQLNRLRQDAQANERSALYQALKVKRLTDTRDTLEDEVLKTFIELTKSDERVAETNHRFSSMDGLYQSKAREATRLAERVEELKNANDILAKDRAQLAFELAPLKNAAPMLKARIAELEAEVSKRVEYREDMEQAKTPEEKARALTTESTNWVGKARVGPLLMGKSTVQILIELDTGAYDWEYYRGPDGLVVGFDSFRAAVTYAADMNNAALAERQAFAEPFAPTAEEAAMDESDPLKPTAADFADTATATEVRERITAYGQRVTPPTEEPEELRVGRLIPPKPTPEEMLNLVQETDKLSDEAKAELDKKLRGLAGFPASDPNSDLVDYTKASV